MTLALQFLTGAEKTAGVPESATHRRPSGLSSSATAFWRAEQSPTRLALSVGKGTRRGESELEGRRAFRVDGTPSFHLQKPLNINSLLMKFSFALRHSLGVGTLSLLAL